MNGVDISNQLVSYYELNFRTLGWWKRIFNEHIDEVIINSLCLFKNSGHLNITPKTYRLNLIKAIIIKNHPFNFVSNIKKIIYIKLKLIILVVDIIVNITQKQSLNLVINVRPLNIMVINEKFFMC